MSSAILSLQSSSLSFGVAEVLLLKKTIMTTGSNSQTGGSLNGRLRLSSHLKVQSLTIMYTIQETKKEAFNHASLSNGLTHWNLLILIQQEAM